MSAVRSIRVSANFSVESHDRIARFAESMGLSKAEAVRTLVEAQLDGQKVRERNQASFERLIQINEYMFHSTIAQNEEQFSPEKQRTIVEDTSNAVNLKHPRIDEDL